MGTNKDPARPGLVHYLTRRTNARRAVVPPDNRLGRRRKRKKERKKGWEGETEKSTKMPDLSLRLNAGKTKLGSPHDPKKGRHGGALSLGLRLLSAVFVSPEPLSGLGHP